MRVGQDSGTQWLFETIGNMKEHYGAGFSEKYGKRIMFVARKTDVQEKRSERSAKVLF